MKPHAPQGSRDRRNGMALLIILILLMIIVGSSASAAWLSHRPRVRAAAAMAVAEAGVHRALAMLESMGPDSLTRNQVGQSVPSTEAFAGEVRIGSLEGWFTVTRSDDADGAVVLTSEGAAGGTMRRLRARVYLASPLLLSALSARGVVSFERQPATVVIVPYSDQAGDRPWMHIAAGRGIEFASPDVSFNNPSVVVSADPGPAGAPDGVRIVAGIRGAGPMRILLARGAQLTLGPNRLPVDIQQLQVQGVLTDGTVLRRDVLPAVPEIDRSFFRDLAARNMANDRLNEAAGEFVGNGGLARKRDSLYAALDFEQIGAYLKAHRLAGPLKGVVYIEGGGLSVPDDQRLRVADGTLVAEGTVELGQRAWLEVIHSPATRRQAGIIVLDRGSLVVMRQARLRAHGLVIADRLIDVGLDASVDIVGAVLGNDPGLSFRAYGAAVVIRYDPAVLGTPGLRPPPGGPVVAWVAVWEELP